ncbi:MAG: DNA mismatch endonuclease Vsr [Anaerolineae bacterium CFX3]|nr:DNA mismatch endonuclease Vsr [Anaerolineae bacterium CFX3]MCQ3946832.1 very short patch repair endonuclease [Anaerolineae bacterium]
MMDVLTPEQRKLNMSRIRNKDTRPEIVVRSLIHRMGYRYRLHVKNLSGKPDLVFPRRRKIIFVHGCFWHMHNCKYGRVKPQTNAEFWENKRLGNIERDRKNLSLLKKDGWKVLVVWECWIRNPQSLADRILIFLEK